MSAMSELAADRDTISRLGEGPIALAPGAQSVIREALNEVSIRAHVAEECGDVEATIQALREVSWAVIHAAELIRSAERATRALALAQHKDAA